MNRDDIIRMAREAGSVIELVQEKDLRWLERFADLVAAQKTEVAIAEAYRCGYEAGVIEEREECAKLAEKESLRGLPEEQPEGEALLRACAQIAGGVLIAAAIRDRGKE